MARLVAAVLHCPIIHCWVFLCFVCLTVRWFWEWSRGLKRWHSHVLSNISPHELLIKTKWNNSLFTFLPRFEIFQHVWNIRMQNSYTIFLQSVKGLGQIEGHTIGLDTKTQYMFVLIRLLTHIQLDLWNVRWLWKNSQAWGKPTWRAELKACPAGSGPLSFWEGKHSSERTQDLLQRLPGHASNMAVFPNQNRTHTNSKA